jgi:hypothetical protein
VLARRLGWMQVRMDPRNGRAWHSLGLMASRAGNMLTAEQHFREGVAQGRAGRHKAKCYDKLAMEMSVRGEVDEARQLYSDGCDAAPTSAYHLRQWALFEKKNGAWRRVRGAALRQLRVSRNTVVRCTQQGVCSASESRAAVPS